MGVQWLAEQLGGKDCVENFSFPGGNLLDIVIRGSLGVGVKNHKIYMPTNEEYIVDQDIVEKARSLGADIIVCDNWCAPTNAAFEYGRKIGVRVYKSGSFLRKLERGEKV